MLRPFVSFATLALIVLALPANATEPAALEKNLAVQKAMATARQFLDVNMPAEAIGALEPEITNADGGKAFLSLLREAYLAEMFRLEKADKLDTARIEQLRKNLGLLGAATPAAKQVAQPSDSQPQAHTDSTADAAAAFKKGEYADAARLFAAASNLAPEQKAAWAYCRVKLAADRVNDPKCDSAAAAAALKDVTEALQLVPQNADLQKVGQSVIATAKEKAKTSPAASGPDVVETASFRIRHSGNRELADAVAKAAETERKTIFERWSGPPSGAWEPKCEIVIHATADAYAKATSRPANSNGTATVRLTDNRPTERRIDLRADDTSLAANALPRELTHVVLADLFADKPPPRWAEEGMAVLACSHEEIGRYTRTLPRCARDGDWFGLAQLLDLKDFPAEKITGFYCQSVSLTDYLIRAGGGERNFTIFLRDCQRYGTAQALRRQYRIDSPQALETSWKRAALEVGRAQAP